MQVLKSHKFTTTTISIGNLAIGGTGKTPMVEYLLNAFKNKKIAVLSRGYKRTTKEFIEVNEIHLPSDVGDENFQLYKKFPNTIIACDNNRVNGLKKIINSH